MASNEDKLRELIDSFLAEAEKMGCSAVVVGVRCDEAYNGQEYQLPVVVAAQKASAAGTLTRLRTVINRLDGIDSSLIATGGAAETEETK